MGLGSKLSYSRAFKGQDKSTLRTVSAELSIDQTALWFFYANDLDNVWAANHVDRDIIREDKFKIGILMKSDLDDLIAQADRSPTLFWIGWGFQRWPTWSLSHD